MYILHSFSPWRYEKNTSKVGYFSKIADIFNTALTAKSAEQQQKYKVHLCFYSTYLAYVTLHSFIVLVSY